MKYPKKEYNKLQKSKIILDFAPKTDKCNLSITPLISKKYTLQEREELKKFEKKLIAY